MKAPTSTYGCGAHSCEECYGDEEWRIATIDGYLSDLTDEELDDLERQGFARRRSGRWDATDDRIALRVGEELDRRHAEQLQADRENALANGWEETL